MGQMTDFLKKGKEKEIEFGTVYCKFHSYDLSQIEEASIEDDIYRHIDIWISSYGYDVKAAKKTSRSDSIPDYSIHWVELRNVKGEKGWVFGQADNIAFELEDSWAVVSRVGLVKALRGKVDFSSFTTNRDEFFRVYRRNNRLDAIIKVPTTFIVEISSEIIPKT